MSVPTVTLPSTASARRSTLASFSFFARDFNVSVKGVRGRAAFFTLLGAITEGFGLVLLLPVITVVSRTGFGNGAIDRAAAAITAMLPGGSAMTRLAWLLALFAVLMAIRAWSIVNRDVLLSRLQTGFVESLRVRVVTALSQADWRVLARLRHGRIAHVLSNDIGSCGLAAHLTLQSTIAMVLLAVQMTLALLLSPAVAAIVLAMLATGALFIRPALRRSRQLGVELTESHYRLTDDTGQFLGGLKLAFSQNLQGSFTAEFRATLAYGATREVAFARQRAIGQVALTSLAAVTAAVALLLGFGVFGTSASALIALLLVLARMSGPAAQLQQNLQHIAHSLPAYEQIRSLEDELAELAVREGRSGNSPSGRLARGDIVMTGVSFAHGAGADGPTGVVGIDLVLRPGEFVGITGASGAGKTTLVDLLVGLLVPDRGTIDVGGHRLNQVNLAAWRDGLSYVSQDPYLFNDSVAGNLRWAKPDASEQDMWDALELAGAATLVAGLPRALETFAGERGSRLSGGERQRIALARALIRRPSLLILDEATNAIDVAAEGAILRRLASLASRPTVLMIAHREQSLSLCERLIVLDRGRIVETIDDAG